MKALIYELQLQSPVLISQPGAGEENSDKSYPFINGSAMRGALAARYLNSNEPDEIFHRRFLSGKVRFLNAYPVYAAVRNGNDGRNRHGVRMLPAPLSWHIEKDATDQDEAQVTDFVFDAPDLDNPKSLGERFVTFRNEDVGWAATDMQVTVHNVSHARKVKAKGTSSLFQYEAIAPGQLFSGVILGEEEDLTVIENLLEARSDLWLGGSRNAGYGRTRLVSTKIEDAWQEYPATKHHPPEGTIVITLLSDVIIRNANGNYSIRPYDLIQQEPQKVFMRTRVVGGFNRTWGLPVVQAPVFQAGSVFVYDSSSLDANLLQKWQEIGLGERRAEGFGRIAVNWLFHPDFSLKRIESMVQDNQIGDQALSPLDEESKTLAQHMANRRYRAVLDERLMSQVSKYAIQTRGMTNAQLNKLRSALRRVQRRGNWNPLEDHLNNLNTDARKQMQRARIDGEKLLDWLHQAKGHKIWERYFSSITSPTIAGTQAQVDDALKLAYVVRFLDALLQKASKENRGG